MRSVVARTSSALRRVAAGEFDLSCAVPLEGLDADTAALRRVPLARMLPWMPSVTLTEAGVRRAAHGNGISAADTTADGRPGDWPAGPVRLVTASGELLAVADGGSADARWPLHPSVVLT